MNNEEKIVNEQTAPEKKSFWAKLGAGFVAVFVTLGRWLKRMFMGASKELSNEQMFSVEAIESPAKQTVKAFFRNKLAVVALVILVFMFGLSFIGSLFLPLDFNYSEAMHKNVAPNSSMLSVPSSLAKDVKSISSFSHFSVGVSNQGKLYVWGSTKLPISTTGSINMKDYPEELDETKVLFAAAGYDHAIAITENGKVVGWGEYDNAQYGDEGSLYGSKSQVIDMPDSILNGTIDVSKVKSLVCGYQVSAILMEDGSVIGWGNYKSGAGNLKALTGLHNVDQIVFSSTQCGAILKDGSLWLGNAKSTFGLYERTLADGTMQVEDLIEGDYLSGRKLVSIAATNDSMAFVTEDGELIITGKYTPNSKNSVALHALAENEKIVEISGGTKHFMVRTNQGNVYAFGQNELKQCSKSATTDENGRIFACAFQSYVVNGENQLTSKWGLKGYFMGTDELGRDVFARIVNGGKMTMTIGAVAVIISTIIGIIIGVISGYFGGWVDILLMRITEVFSAIPFLPFALILSTVLAGSSLSENMRIFMIMVILGLLSWTGLAHMVRGQILAEREKEYVVAAKAMGVKESKIAFKHILPNVISIILVSVTLDFAGCMLTESSLSYLGFGVKLPRPTWGNMLDGANNEIVIGTYWWRWVFPSVCLLLSTISINIIGDTLRDVMDPKSSADR